MPLSEKELLITMMNKQRAIERKIGKIISIIHAGPMIILSKVKLITVHIAE